MGAAVTVSCLSEQCRGNPFAEEHNTEQDSKTRKDTIHVDLSHLQVTAYGEDEVDAPIEDYHMNKQQSAEIWCERHEDLVSGLEFPGGKEITFREAGAASGGFAQSDLFTKGPPAVSEELIAEEEVTDMASEKVAVDAKRRRLFERAVGGLLGLVTCQQGSKHTKGARQYVSRKARPSPKT